MNKFDLNFFQKYIPEGQRLMFIIHTHPIKVLKSLIVKLALLVILPSFFYYYSITIRELLPFYFLEGFLIVVFIKIIYDIFDWYNDVWIITNEGVLSIEWSFLKINTDSVNFENIEGIGVEQNGIIDKILKKGDLIISKIGDDSFILTDAINPFKAVDKLETITQEVEQTGAEDDRFDMIMDALGGVVGDYLENNEKKSEKEEKYEKIIKKIEDKDSTIDLR